MTHTIDDLAKKMTEDVNHEIAQACAGESGLRWQTTAENIANERLAGEWEWILYSNFGEQPKIAITRYLK